MRRLFVMTHQFDRQWQAMGLTDPDLARLQQGILENPQIGPVIPGTGRLRKLRFAFEGQGKRGSIRVAYVDFSLYEIVYLITAYPKSEKDNLSKAERNAIKKQIDAIEAALAKSQSTEEKQEKGRK